MSPTDTLNTFAAVDQLIGTVMRIGTRIYKAYGDQEVHAVILKNNAHELNIIRDIVSTVQEVKSLQTATVVRSLHDLKDYQLQLEECMEKSKSKNQSAICRVGSVALYGDMERKKMETIMQGISQTKHDLMLHIQMAMVGLVGTVEDAVLFNGEVVQNVHNMLEKRFGSGQGLKVAECRKKCPARDDGIVVVPNIIIMSMGDGRNADGVPAKTIEHVIMNNVAKDTALQINGVMGEQEWMKVARLVVKDNRAEGDAVQFNGTITDNTCFEALRARNKHAAKSVHLVSRSRVARK